MSEEKVYCIPIKPILECKDWYFGSIPNRRDYYSFVGAKFRVLLAFYALESEKTKDEDSFFQVEASEIADFCAVNSIHVRYFLKTLEKAKEKGLSCFITFKKKGNNINRGYIYKLQPFDAKTDECIYVTKREIQGLETGAYSSFEVERFPSQFRKSI